MKVPNILFQFSEQQRYDTLEVVNPRIQTPHLYRLAASGSLFERVHSVIEHSTEGFACDAGHAEGGLYEVQTDPHLVRNLRNDAGSAMVRP